MTQLVLNILSAFEELHVDFWGLANNKVTYMNRQVPVLIHSV